MVNGITTETARKSHHIALRRRLEGIEFQKAVGMVMRSLFQFTHRASNSKALWSSNQAVWLGKSTFLHWSLTDEFDVPWLLAKAKNAPLDHELLHERVKSELTSYFSRRLSKLPKRSTGSWLPLP